MTRQLPSNPSLAQLRKQAKDILKAHKSGNASCCAILRNMRQFKDKPDVDILKADLVLQEVQFALALEYGFKTWAELKKHALGKTAAGKFFHIHCGDSSANTLQKSKVPGDVLVWREIYLEGPVPGNLPEQDFQKIRAKFLTTFGLDYDGVLQGAAERYKRIKEAGKYDEVILWFDACMFDQTIMIHLVDLCARQSWTKTKFSLICVGEFAGFGRFCGLGELSPDQLASLFDTRHEVTQAEIHLAGKAWKAFTSADPRDIENLLRGDFSALPYLKDALLRHLQQFPSVRNGLNRLENQILSVVASGTRKLGPIFSTVSNKEERPFFGDASLWSCINQLASHKEPLLRVSGPGSLTELMNINSDELPSLKMKKRRLFDVDITDVGKAVLAGKQDAVKLNGISRWLGGVHLRGPEAQWRWDEKSRRLVEMQVAAISLAHSEPPKEKQMKRQITMPAPAGESGNTYAHGISAVLAYLGADISYDQIMGLTGVAFILQVDTSGPFIEKTLDCAWWPNDPWGFDLGLPVLSKAVGWKIRNIRSDWEAYKADPAAEYRRAFAHAIEQSLQAGRPVLAKIAHCFIVTGVDDQEPPLLGYGTRGKSTQFLQNTMRIDRYPWGIYVIAEETTAGNSAEVDLTSLRYIIALFDERAQGPDASKTRFSGRQAWVQWLRLLHSGEACDNNMLIHLRYNRRSAVAYLREMAGRHDGTTAIHLGAAADLYQRALEDLTAGELPYPGPTKGGPAAYTNMVERVFKLEANAVAELEAATAIIANKR